MRYNNRIELVYVEQSQDELHGGTTETKVIAPCLMVPITDVQKLSVYGLVGKPSFEVHLKGRVAKPDKVQPVGSKVAYTVGQTVSNRKSTVLIVSGGG